MTDAVLELVTPPATEPIELEEAKAHLRVDYDDEDSHILDLIAAARDDAERSTRRALITQTWRLTMPAFSTGRLPVELLRAPVQSITSVTYTDATGAEVVMDEADYVFSAGEPGRIVPVSGAVWPTVQTENPAGVVIEFVAGYGDASTDVPYLLRQAMLLFIGTEYNHRENIITGTITNNRRAIESIYRKFAWDLVLA